MSRWIKLISIISFLGIAVQQQELNPIEEQVDDFSTEISEQQLKAREIKIGKKLTYLDSPLIDVVWCGNSDQIHQILVLSEKGSVYLSEDSGVNWKKKTEEFQHQALYELDENEESGTVERLLVSPVDKNLVLFIGTEGVNWRSGDCGKEIIAMNQGRRVTEFQFHPVVRNKLLAVAWSKCEDYTDTPCTLQKELYYSNDIGESWQLIEDYVLQFQWGYVDHTFKGKVPIDRIILAHQKKGEGHQNITRWSKAVQLSYSDDYFSTSHTMLKHGNKFLLTSQFLYAVQVTNEQQQKINLLVAQPAHPVYSFHKTQFPFGQLSDSGYTIVDSSSSQVFLNVNHQGPQAFYGHLYTSDSQGIKFALSLQNNARNPDGVCDFEKVLSMPGIYLTNFYDHSIVAKQKKQAEQSNNNNNNNNKFQIEEFKKTRISFSSGGSWQPVTPPRLDNKGKQINCDLSKGCSLHFHTVTSSDMYGSFYSSEQATGVVLGVGNIGRHLSNRRGEVDTFLSRDGGRTWAMTQQGSHVYEIGDHGGLLLLASDEQPTDHLLYSYDEGLHWHSYTFSQQQVSVTNILTHPNNHPLVFLLYAQDPHGQALLITLDFATFINNPCKGYQIPDHQSSDYSLWNINPTDCLLGQREKVVRKKPTSFCQNGPSFQKTSFKSFCKCTDIDYECDVGYSRKDQGPCKLTNLTLLQQDIYSGYAQEMPPDQVISHCKDYYLIKSGYRKIPATMCKGGLTYEPVKIPCPKAINERNSNHEYLNRKRQFDYSKFDNDDAEMDFSKMVFDEEQDEVEILDEKIML